MGQSYFCMYTVTISLPSMFLCLAILINISCWISFNLKVRAVRLQKLQLTSVEKHLAFQQRTLNITTVLLCLAAWGGFMYFYCSGCSDSYITAHDQA